MCHCSSRSPFPPLRHSGGSLEQNIHWTASEIHNQWHMCKFKENPWRFIKQKHTYNSTVETRFIPVRCYRMTRRCYEWNIQTSQVIFSNVVFLLLRFRTCLYSQHWSVHNSPFVSSRLQYRCIDTVIANKHSFKALCLFFKFCYFG